MRRLIEKNLLLAVLIMMPAWPITAADFDHGHTAWDRLLNKHVIWNPAGTASQVDYAGFQQNQVLLRNYLDILTAVTRDEFDRWDRDQQLAFLINAYNAFTVELILTEYPHLKSIKELGSLFSSPWKKKFFHLLGEKRHLDDLEHNLIRGSARYNEPLIHFAVNCASIGCPALRTEAYVAGRLNEQLLDSTRRFLEDRSRNRFDARSSRLEVSKIFDWYAEDFARGWRGYDSLHDFFRTHADWITNNEESERVLKSQVLKVRFLDYDWKLNGKAE